MTAVAPHSPPRLLHHQIPLNQPLIYQNLAVVDSGRLFQSATSGPSLSGLADLEYPTKEKAGKPNSITGSSSLSPRHVSPGEPGQGKSVRLHNHFPIIPILTIYYSANIPGPNLQYKFILIHSIFSLQASTINLKQINTLISPYPCSNSNGPRLSYAKAIAAVS